MEKEAAWEARESHGTARKRARSGGGGEDFQQALRRHPRHHHLPPSHQGRRPHGGPLPPMAPSLALCASQPRGQHPTPRHRRPRPHPSCVPPSAVSQIISQHHGPARRFSFHYHSAGDLCAQAESWLHSRALANLEELDIAYATPRLLASVLRSASTTILAAKINGCDFPREIVPAMNFPNLKKLTLFHTSISEDVLHALLSGCHALESLYMAEVSAACRLRVSSPTLKTIIFSHSSSEMAQLVILDAPRLVRLLLPYYYGSDRVTIRVAGAPMLEILGPFIAAVSNILLFQGISPVSSANSMRTIKVLALRSSADKLHAVLNILRWFPCLERLHVTVVLMPKDCTIFRCLLCF
uniref:F-box/LRR-repeat protein 15/At3g58940/PEG3-like LRR domain-containing protein n=1 Tax=Aegilops tauschii TaxID=37682 RepID=R7W4E3_AEGTA